MPCNSDHLHPTEREAYNKKAATLLLYVYLNHSKIVPIWLKKAAQDTYGCFSEYPDLPTRELCAYLRKLESDNAVEFEELVYDGREKMSRALADWWEEHCKADKKKQKGKKEKLAPAVSDLFNGPAFQQHKKYVDLTLYLLFNLGEYIPAWLKEEPIRSFSSYPENMALEELKNFLTELKKQDHLAFDEIVYGKHPKSRQLADLWDGMQKKTKKPAAKKKAPAKKTAAKKPAAKKPAAKKSGKATELAD